MRAILLAAMAAVPAVADPALLPGLYTGELPSGVAVELQVESRSADGALSA
ncbi:MAG: hypothetical protein IT452_00990, partial [Planctomycetia bacterium]|nr:hypothetical protein [Planctomycetia bacterium]